MEGHGVRVDPQALEAMSATMEGEVRGLERQIWELAGTEFNVNSPPQLAEILFDKLNLQTPTRRGRGKVRSTAAGILEELALVHDLPRKVIEYREVAKLKSTYVDALPKLIHPRTGRLHTSFNQAGTATGRLSSSEPNLQNIPIRTELAGRSARRLSPSPAGLCFLRTTRRSSCASWPTSRTTRCWSRHSARARTSTRARRKRCSASGRWAKTLNTAARPRSSTLASSTGFRPSAWRSS